jgi:hypothetical protein
MLNKFSLFLLLVGLTAFYACKDKLVDNPLSNKPPTTKIFLNPDSVLSKQQSNIHLYWSGDDPDGTVIGFYFSWNGINWTFTTKNDSLFSLQIGAVDTIFSFRVSAVDNSGNGIYKSDVYQNGIHYGPEPFTDFNGNGIRDANVGEPFTDLNGNGRYDPGEPFVDIYPNGKYDFSEPFVDIGLIDPNPAMLKLPIKNTAPTIEWDALSTHPDSSFTAMTFGWDARDIDGDMTKGVNTIQNINIALNDTNKFVALNGTVSVITIRTVDFTNPNPLMDIYINGDITNLPFDSIGHKILLPGLIYNSNNIFYVQAVDISGAKSPWISSATQPKSHPAWYVKKPKGHFVIVDDYKTIDNTAAFYKGMMEDTLGLSGKYDVYDLFNQLPPYLNITFLETIKLFPCAIWYSDINGSIDLASATTQKYLDFGGKICFSMQFQQSVDMTQIQGFLPILVDTSYLNSGFLPSGLVFVDTTHSGYPDLKTNISLPFVRSFHLSNVGVNPIYFFKNKVLNGYIGFENNDRSLFFIGAPLNKLSGLPGSVSKLLDKVLFHDFNITP